MQSHTLTFSMKRLWSKIKSLFYALVALAYKYLGEERRFEINIDVKTEGDSEPQVFKDEVHYIIIPSPRLFLIMIVVNMSYLYKKYALSPNVISGLVVQNEENVRNALESGDLMRYKGKLYSKWCAHCKRETVVKWIGKPPTCVACRRSQV